MVFADRHGDRFDRLQCAHSGEYYSEVVLQNRHGAQVSCEEKYTKYVLELKRENNETFCDSAR